MGTHEDTWWPIDGPARDGRMVWPPRKPAHRAGFIIETAEAYSAIHVRDVKAAEAFVAELLAPPADRQ